MKTLAELIQRNAQIHGDRVAVIDGIRQITHGELAERASCIAGILSESFEMRPQDRFLILSKNRLEMMEMLAASALSGFVIVPLNWRLAAAELAVIVSDAEPKMIFVEPGLAQLWTDVATRLERHLPVVWLESAEQLTPSLPDLMAGAHPFLPATPPAPDATVHIIYTSGTTGKPKGAMLSQAGMLAGAEHVSAFAGHRPTDRIMVVMPLFHVGGIIEWYAVQYLGGSCVVMAQFEPLTYTAEVARTNASVAHLAPVMVKRLVEIQEKGQHDISSLRRIHYGSAPVAPDDLRHAHMILGPILNQLYGMTESPAVSMLLAYQQEPDGDESAQRRLASAGHVYPNADVWIEGSDGMRCAAGAIGEIIVKSPAQFTGYWKNPEATAAALVNGAVRTGDLGFFDDHGYLYVVDRAKDVIVSGGENIYSREVEDALMEYPAVMEAAVVSAPDEQWGEAVVAHVVLQPEAGHVNEATLIAHCRTLIAGYKRPRQVIFLEALPRLPHGKIDKKVLRQRLWAGRNRMVS